MNKATYDLISELTYLLGRWYYDGLAQGKNDSGDGRDSGTAYDELRPILNRYKIQAGDPERAEFRYQWLELELPERIHCRRYYRSLRRSFSRDETRKLVSSLSPFSTPKEYS